MPFDDNLPLALRYHDILKAIYDYIQEFNRPPYHDNRWLVKRTNSRYKSNHITQMKKDLVEMQLLTTETNLTAKGERYIHNHFGPFIVRKTTIRIQGMVTAGPSDASVNIEDFDTPSEKTIDIPSISTHTNKDTFALQVSGDSMEEEGILDGDFVIVEKQDSLWWPSPQDIIVASYLPYHSDYVETSQITPDDYVGPVLKVYVKRYGEKGCELGWRKFNEENKKLIQALDLKPIGKVIGVYRDVQNFLSKLG